jgi:hypothetical protein
VLLPQTLLEPGGHRIRVRLAALELELEGREIGAELEHVVLRRRAGDLGDSGAAREEEKRREEEQAAPPRERTVA